MLSQLIIINCRIQPLDWRFDCGSIVHIFYSCFGDHDYRTVTRYNTFSILKIKLQIVLFASVVFLVLHVFSIFLICVAILVSFVSFTVSPVVLICLVYLHSIPCLPEFFRLIYFPYLSCRTCLPCLVYILSPKYSIS